MRWNWQQPDWPMFTWDRHRFEKAEALFLIEAGMFVGAVRHLENDSRDQLIIEIASTEALTTSAIEGEILDRARVQSSLRKYLGITSSQRRATSAEEGISKLMISLLRTYAQPLTDEMLFEWHIEMTAGRRDIIDVGTYRTHSEPMQVVSGSPGNPTTHFEAPPSAQIPGEMKRFITWFQETSPSGTTPLPALTRAAIAHLYFVSIHPFEDGNGRIGRAIAEKAIADSLGQSTLTMLSATILSKRKEYYAALAAASRHNEVTPWIAWFAATAIESQRQLLAWSDFLINKTRLLDRLRSQLNPRQEKILYRMLQEGISGFKGGLSAGNYMRITSVSPATAGRDLSDMVEKGALTRTGELRYARYHVNIPVQPIGTVQIDSEGNLTIETKS